MAKYVIEDTTMTGLANEVRTLTGDTEAKTPGAMKTDLQEANAAVQSQTALIGQIKTALEEKAGGGSVQTVSVTITDWDGGTFYYKNPDANVMSKTKAGTETIDVPGGMVIYYGEGLSELGVELTGVYTKENLIKVTDNSIYATVVIFAENGGTMEY